MAPWPSLKCLTRIKFFGGCIQSWALRIYLVLWVFLQLPRTSVLRQDKTITFQKKVRMGLNDLQSSLRYPIRSNLFRSLHLILGFHNIYSFNFMILSVSPRSDSRKFPKRRKNGTKFSMVPVPDLGFQNIYSFMGSYACPQEE